MAEELKNNMLGGLRRPVPCAAFLGFATGRELLAAISLEVQRGLVYEAFRYSPPPSASTYRQHYGFTQDFTGLERATLMRSVQAIMAEREPGQSGDGRPVGEPRHDELSGPCEAEIFTGPS